MIIITAAGSGEHEAELRSVLYKDSGLTDYPDCFKNDTI